LGPPPKKAGAIAGRPGPSSIVGELSAEPATRASFDLRPSIDQGEAVLARIFLSSLGEGIGA
jgi:hypothetical protein